VAAPPAALGIAVHGPGAARLARSLRARGNRAIAATAAPTQRWLRDAGFDAGVVIDGGGDGGGHRVVLADDSRRDLESAISSLLED
jgi:hypothetical protein